MAKLKADVPAATRSDALGVHSVDHFVLEVPDLELGRQFYANFGLGVREVRSSLHLCAGEDSHCWGILTEGSKKRLHSITFGAFEEDLAEFKKRLDQMGIRRLDPPRGFGSDGLWFRDIDDTLIEIRVAEKSSPNEKSPVSNPSPPPGVRGMPGRGEAPGVRPRRFSHILVFTRDVARAINFYSSVLGLRLSDEAGVVAFMHGVHGSDHHVLAFAKSEGAGLHHTSWDVASVQEIGLGAMRMAESGFAQGWGLGRHVLGSNYFHYIRDPWGSYAEYSSDIDFIPCRMEWKSVSHNPEDAFYLWGPTPPADFAKNYEIGA